jgi:hypothetical protein
VPNTCPEGSRAAAGLLQGCWSASARFHQVKRRALLLRSRRECHAQRGRDRERLTGLLLAQLDLPAAEAQASALRALRRFPSADTRAALVKIATALLKQGETVRQLTTTLATLSSRTTPRWCAPLRRPIPTRPTGSRWSKRSASDPALDSATR